MTDLTKYNSEIAWFTLAKDVFQLTREATDPATFRMTVKSIDPNNKGAGLKAIGYTFTDNIGVPYSIIAVNTNTIDVADVFRQGCPVGGKKGIIHKSAYKGYSIALPSELLFRLHPIAASNNNKFAMAILWQNDPNALRIPFTGTDNPQITGYQSPQTISGKIYNLAEDYDDDPKCRLMEIIEVDFNSVTQTITRERTEKALFTFVDGLIDTIRFCDDTGLGETISGYIEISH
jgi:hypothetical protein